MTALSFVPGIGPVVDITSAFGSFATGDYVGGTLDLTSGVVNLFLPGGGSIVKAAKSAKALKALKGISKATSIASMAYIVMVNGVAVKVH
jgi:hypothetical protein